MERVVLRHLSGSKSQQVEEIPLDAAQEIVFGRDPSATVRYDAEHDDLVGRVHARLSQDPADRFRFTIADLKSRNGTYVNRRRLVAPGAINPGDIIQFGPGGPELQFDLEPLPQALAKATQIASGRDVGKPAAPVAATVESATPPAMAQLYDFVGSARSDVGCVRTVNEDQVRLVHVHDEAVLANRGVLVLVADGIGGNRAGEVASEIAVDTMHTTYYEALGSPRDALIRAFEAANHTVYAVAESHPRFAGMGTTATALVLYGDRAFSANVGDSRIYLVRDDGIYRMTSDDSVVGALVSQGLLSAADARHHAEKNVILRAIGTSPALTLSTWDTPFPIRGGDRFLLCSDGLHDLVDDEEIRDAMVGDAPVISCERLIALARSRGGHDNIAVAVVHVVAHDTRQVRAQPGPKGIEHCSVSEEAPRHDPSAGEAPHPADGTNETRASADEYRQRWQFAVERWRLRMVGSGAIALVLVAVWVGLRPEPTTDAFTIMPTSVIQATAEPMPLPTAFAPHSKLSGFARYAALAPGTFCFAGRAIGAP